MREIESVLVADMISAYENNINKSAISKNYDFSEELLKVQQ